VLGKHTLDEMLSERERLNLDMQKILDSQTDAWGIKVTNVEIKHVDLERTMIRAIARQAEAERERRAKVIHAEGELQAREKLAEAARSWRAAAGDAAALPGNADGDRRRQELDHRLSPADGHRRAAARRTRAQGAVVFVAGRESSQAPPGAASRFRAMRTAR
jgi:regulator of protease activity HflC (stomatin/prohibitin superfamily)